MEALADPSADVRDRYVNLRYDHTDTLTGETGFVSSQLPLVALAIAVTGLTHSGAVLDLRVLGGLSAILLGLLSALLVAVLPGGRVLRLAAGGALLFVLADSAVAVYLSSLYSEPASLLGAVLLVAACLRALREPRLTARRVALVGVCSLPLLLAKTQNAPLVVVVVAVLLLGTLRRGVPAAVRAVAVGCAALLVVACAVFVGGQPTELQQANNYNSVFYGVLAQSADPAGDLRDLGLDPGLARWAGTSFFARPNGLADPLLRTDEVGPARVALFYARHPGTALALVADGARAAMRPRPTVAAGVLPPAVPAIREEPRLGNYPAGSGHPPYAVSHRFSLVSAASARLAGAGPVLLPTLGVFALLAAAALLRQHRRGRDAALGRTLVVVVAMAVLQFAVTLLGDGRYELAKHLFLFDVLASVGAVLAAVATARLIPTYRVRGLASGRTGARRPAPPHSVPEPP